jgi:hypothetical protein
MEIMDLIAQIFEVCIIPLMGILTAYFVKWIGVKTEELKEETKNEKTEKYLDMLNNTITNCVIATTQTYVDTLKAQGAFDMEAQKTAFTMTYDAVAKLLTNEATEYLNEAVGDLNLYITQKIEAEVNLNKTIKFE